MFVDANDVEPQLLGVLQLIQVAIIENIAFFGIVEAIGTGDPGGLVPLCKISRQMRP